MSAQYRIRFADGSFCDEGPWDTRTAAQRFLSAEVGVPATVEPAAPSYGKELRDAARRQRQYDRAWERYVEALQRAADKQSDGRANYARRRAVRAARRNLENVCTAQGIAFPVSA